MFKFIARKIFGSKNERYIKKIRPLLQEINKLEERCAALADADFPALISKYKEEAQNGRSLDSLLPEVFALVREAGKRVLDMRHFDVQLVGGIVLHNGKIAEMRTGEGKTLVATLPVVLNSLSGKGVHVVTVNDYLARRDAEWMGRLYNFLGLSVGVIVHGLSDAERKAAYGADITYGTNNEFGFDYLRDNMKFYPEHLVQRGHNFAIVDEVDSILIDEARTPLIISGPSEDSTDLYRKIDSIIPRLQAETEYVVDEKARTATLTEEGVAKVEHLLRVDNLFDPQNISLQHHVLQALKAHKVFKRDVDYIVNEGQVVIVDEFTGRTMPGRRFSDGLHQALEAKENVKVEAENQTLASITFQNYFRLYDKLSGMTGTADTEAVEFHEVYRLEVLSIPTHRPMIRNDMADLVYRSKDEKYQAIIEEISGLYQKGQPVLVGTISIEISELISEKLKKANIPHNVLNAKQHDKEAAIIAEAGQRGKVTVATNMAGRGTDIVLGEGVRELGGLHILGTERHESRRIDNQLRGRSGRQGDPGSSRFYLSLEDDLMRLFGADRHIKLMESLGLKDGEAIEHKLISKAIQNAQKRVEGHNFEIRKSLLDFDNVMNQQREVVYTLRREAMNAPDLESRVEEFVSGVLEDIYAPVEAAKGPLEEDQHEMILSQLEEVANLNRDQLAALQSAKGLPAMEAVKDEIIKGFDINLRQVMQERYIDLLRYFTLEELDRAWKEHLLNMDHLRDGIGLRGYGQRDPKQEYKREGFAMFQDMLERIRENVVKILTHLRLHVQEAAPAVEVDAEAAVEAEARAEEPESRNQPAKGGAALELKHKETTALSYSGAAAEAARKAPVKRESPKVGRNDDCPCGSGKKYKKCCGAGQQ